MRKILIILFFILISTTASFSQRMKSSLAQYGDVILEAGPALGIGKEIKQVYQFGYFAQPSFRFLIFRTDLRTQLGFQYANFTNYSDAGYKDALNFFTPYFNVLYNIPLTRDKNGPSILPYVGVGYTHGSNILKPTKDYDFDKTPLFDFNGLNGTAGIQVNYLEFQVNLFYRYFRPVAKLDKNRKQEILEEIGAINGLYDVYSIPDRQMNMDHVMIAVGYNFMGKFKR